MMKFLLDVCAGGRLSNWLHSEGFELEEVRTIDKGMPDNAIIEWAIKDNCIIVTLDKDFGELFVMQGKMCSIIRLPDVSAEQRIKLMKLVLEKYFELLKKSFVIITVSEKRIRVRYLDSLKGE